MLTILGMMIGAGSVIAVLGIGTIVSDAIAGSFRALGDPGMFVTVDTAQDDPTSARLQYKDATAVAEENPATLHAVFPVLQRTYRITANEKNTVGVVLSTDGIVPNTHTTIEGRLIDAADIASARRVCVLSISLKNYLFDHEHALEKIIRINDVRFRVVGIRTTNDANFFSTGSRVYTEIPYSTFHIVMPGSIDGLRIISSVGISPSQARRVIIAALHRLHGKHASYTIDDAHVMIATFEKALHVIMGCLVAIDGIALLIAGIGVMNVMLASVNERMREIGVRKAIGADDNDIFMQFIVESMVISASGCAGGTVLGYAITVIAHGFIVKLLGPAPIPWRLLMTLAVLFSLLTGAIFGVYPALRARKLDPIQALRP